MAYTKTTWVDGENKYDIKTQADVVVESNIKMVYVGTGGTPVSAANLNKIEDQLALADNASGIDYDPTISGLEATNVKTALDELSANFDLVALAKYYGKYSLMSGGAITAPGIVVFNSEDNDDFAAINLASSTSRITIPSGVTLIKLFFSGRLVSSNATAYSTHVKLYKNGSDTGIPMGSGSPASGRDGFINSYSVPIEVTAGDYFEIYYEDGGYTTADLTVGNFMLEVLA